MTYLILTILLTSSLTLAFEVLGRLKIPVLQAIVFNYITCVITGMLVNNGYPWEAWRPLQDWVRWALLMGVFFIVLFNIIAFTTQHLGVAVASVANKLSLVIPFLFAVLFYGEPLTALKVAGVLLAVTAVVFTCWPHKPIEGSSLRPERGWVLLVPVVLFLGSGTLDTMITYAQRSVVDESQRDPFFITAFGMAGVLGSVYLLYRLLSGRERFDPRAVIAGVCIGLPNYFSIRTLLAALSSYQGNASAIFPIINIGIVLFSTLVAYFVFREKLSKLNWAGIGLAVLAIILMFRG